MCVPDRSAEIGARGGSKAQLDLVPGLLAESRISRWRSCAAPGARGQDFCHGTLQRFFACRWTTRKRRPRHASEQDRPDVARRCEAWFGARPDLRSRAPLLHRQDMGNDQYGRTHGRAPLGANVCASASRTATGRRHPSLQRLALRGMIAPLVLCGPINRAAFEAHVQQVFMPELQPNDIRRHGEPPEPKGANGRRPHQGRRSRVNRGGFPGGSEETRDGEETVKASDFSASTFARRRGRLALRKLASTRATRSSPSGQRGRGRGGRRERLCVIGKA